MRNKRFLASLMLATVLASSVTQVYADTTYKASDGSETSAQVPSELEVMPTLDGITVSIPENLNLTYNESSGKYEAESSISARGSLVDGYVLELSTPSTEYYTLDGKVIEANVSKFDETALRTGVDTALWTSSDLKSANKERQIKLTTKDDVTTKGNTTQKINFNVSLQKVWDADNQYYTSYATAGSSDVNGITRYNKRVNISDIYASNLVLPKYIKDASGNIQGISQYNIVTSSSGQTVTTQKASGVVSLTVPYSADAYSFGSSLSKFTNLKELTIINYKDMSLSTNSTIEAINIKSFMQRKNDSAGHLSTIIFITNLTNLKKLTLSNIENFAISNKTSDSFSNCSNLTDIYVGAKIADVKTIPVINSSYASIGTVGDYDFSTVTDTNSGLYIMSHATWHCSDGTYVPATGVETPSN